MSLYVLGNLTGRLVLSYVIVWIVLLLVARFDWRGAFRRSARWYNVVAVLAVFLLGVGTMYRNGGIDA